MIGGQWEGEREREVEGSQGAGGAKGGIKILGQNLYFIYTYIFPFHN